MSRIKIDAVAAPLSGHLYPVLLFLAPLLNDLNYEIRIFTGPQKLKVAEVMALLLSLLWKTRRSRDFLSMHQKWDSSFNPPA
ncbi:hypothetical protein [Streptococcus australis]|uniref:hypothetical protein n=1 Tax=Streptococcus australis TaxID=113107 RepID=UPI0039C45220